MNIARVLSFGTMILISLLRSLLAFQLMIVGCVMCFAVLGLLLVVYEYKFVRERTISQKDDEKQFIKIMKILKEQ